MNTPDLMVTPFEIQKITIEHFKKIDNASLSLLKPVTYLVGGNRSGKSSFLQATMMMIAAAQEFQRQKDRQAIFRLEHQLRYCPTHDFAYLGHKQPLDNKKTGYSASVRLDFSDSHYKISFRRARGEANISLLREHTTVSTNTRLIQDHLKPMAVYVPGISGLAKKEDKLHRMQVYRAMFGGDAGLVLRNVLLLINEKKPTMGKDRKPQVNRNLKKLESELSKLIGSIEFEIIYEEEQRSDIIVNIIKENYKFPLELCSIGELQLIQIIAYWILLKPKILLLDEPDSHLHADVQNRLASYLSLTAQEERTKVIIATHSRQMIQSSDSENTELLLIEDGKVAEIKYAKIDFLMHLGALDAHEKQLFIFTEDNEKQYLEALLNQWDDIKGIYKIISYNGRKNLPVAIAHSKVLLEVFPGANAIIHADRDFLTEDEGKYFIKSHGIDYLFLTECSDIEWYFMQPAYLSTKGYQIPESFVPDQEEFNATRGGATSRMNKYTLTKPHQDVWQSLGETYKYKGKTMLALIKKQFKIKSEADLITIPSNIKIAPDLKLFIDKIRSGNLLIKSEAVIKVVAN